MEIKIDKKIADEYNQILDNLGKNLDFSNYYAIRDIYQNPYKTHEFQFIKYQICNCIVMGFYVASITLTNHLLEKFLKTILVINDSKNNEENLKTPFDLIDRYREGNKKYDNKHLYDNIVSAYNEKLIDEGQKIVLLKMKDFFRNPYGHSEKKTMYRENSTEVTAVVGIEEALKVLDGKFDELPKREDKLADLLFGDFIFLQKISSNDCIPYLSELDKIIRNVEEKLYSNSDKISE
jgi:hypothetical protein